MSRRVFVVSFCAFLMTSCGSEVNSEHHDADKLMCELSGGEYTSDGCLCEDGSKASDGICGYMRIPTEEDKKADYGALCELSGGKAIAEEGKGVRCECREKMCDEGAVCDWKTGNCTLRESDGICSVVGNVVCQDNLIYECVKGENSGELYRKKLHECPKGIMCAPSIENVEMQPYSGTGAESAVAYYEKTMCAQCDESICEDGWLIECDNGMWKERTACEVDGKSVSCTQNHSCGECVDGDEKCENENNEAHRYVCDQGEWRLHDNVTCDSGNSCTEAHKCGECVDGTVKCENDSNNFVGALFVCKKGQWTQQEFCKDGVSCRNETDCGECVDEEVTVCQNDETTHKGFYDQCVNGKWETQECQDGNMCTVDGKCGECNFGKNKCENEMNGDLAVGNMMKCQDGKWIKTWKCMADSMPVSCEISKDGLSTCGGCMNSVLTKMKRIYSCTADGGGDMYKSLCIDGVVIDEGIWGGARCNKCSNGLCMD